MSTREQLERVLYILPAAARGDGIAIGDLARALEVDARTVLRDIEDVTAREYYHPAGSVDSFTITVEGDHMRVWAPKDFARPVRLNAREALALGLGLRAMAAECEEPRRSDVLALAERLEHDLQAPFYPVQPRLRELRQEMPRQTEFFARLEEDQAPAPMYDYEPGREQRAQEEDADTGEDAPPLELELAEDELRGVLADAIAQQRACTLTYVKPQADIEQRSIAPVRLVYARGNWYVAAWDIDRAAARLFRLDRVLDAELGEPYRASAEAGEMVERIAHRGEPFAGTDADDAIVQVRYSPRIARWLAEQSGQPCESDGSIVLTHTVADPAWLVRHILQYGGDAQVEGPLRSVVAEAAARMSA